MPGTLTKIVNPFRFDDPAEEHRFVEEFCVAQYRITQVGFLIMSIMLYVFFIWDKTLDPERAELTHAIRGLVIAPMGWIFAALFQVEYLRKRSEWFSSTICVIAISSEIGICLIINKMFDTAVAGGLLLALFYNAFVPCRFPFYLSVNLLTWAIFDAAQYLSGNYSEGMFLINNMFAGSGVLLGILAGAQKEIRARNQFKTDQELRRSKAQIDELLAATLTSYEIARIQRRPSQARDRRLTIAISYRRADSEAIAGRLRDRLVGCYGVDAVFMDIDNIPPGIDFRAHVSSSFMGIDIILAVIGQNWLAVDIAGQQRIKTDNDPVRVELEIALAQNKIVIPVLIGDAPMPSNADLPQSLSQFPYLNAARISPGKDFPHHFELLIRSMDRIAENVRR